MKQREKKTNQKQDTENKSVVTRGKRGCGWVKEVKGINCMVTDDSWPLGVITLQCTQTLNYNMYWKLIFFKKSKKFKQPFLQLYTSG